MDETFWQNKKVLLTGHTGFKGSWLLFWLQSMGAKVIGYSLPPPTHPNLFELISLNNNTHSYYGDILEYHNLHTIIAIEKPEIVFHLAAQSIVRQAYANPMETYSTNIMGTVHLLEALRTIGCARVAIVVTSDKCYANRELARGYRETDAMGGYDPYSSSKGCVELITSAYRNSFYMREGEQQIYLATTRSGNVIGGGDWATDRLIPDFVRAILEDKPILVRYPHAIRPWQHVLEPLSGYLLLAQQLWKNGNDYIGPWNFGPKEEDAKSVEWIINQLIKQSENFESLSKQARWELDDKTRNSQTNLHETLTLKLDITKAQLHLNWKPRWSLETALRCTSDWYKSYYANENIENVMDKQIAKYQMS